MMPLPESSRVSSELLRRSDSGSSLRRIYCHEDKRCMLAFLKSDADFSSGCALSVIRPAFLPTHPTLPLVDRFMLVLSLSNQVSASRCSECLFTDPISCARQ